MADLRTRAFLNNLRPTDYRPAVTQYSSQEYDPALEKAATAGINFALPLGIASMAGPLEMSINRLAPAIIGAYQNLNRPNVVGNKIQTTLDTTNKIQQLNDEPDLRKKLMSLLSLYSPFRGK